MQQIVLIYTTVSEETAAKNLATKAVHGKLAACVNIIPSATSIYEWEGVVQHSSEFLMLFKTTDEKADLLAGWLSEHHPYEVPAIIKANADVSKKFFDYLQKSLIS